MPTQPASVDANPDADRRGRDADSPWSMPLPAWKEVLVRTWQESSADNVGLIAAGTAFYTFLALVPLLGAVVLTYGLLAEPETVIRNMNALTGVLPREVAGIIGDQMMNVVTTSSGKKGLGVAVALGVALFGARNAAGGIVSALNIAYEETEKRGFIRVNLLTLAITACAVLVFVAALLGVTLLGYLEHLLPGLGGFLAVAIKIVSYALLALGAAAVAAALYRFGPSRNKARWTWLSAGSALFAVAWVILTLGFGYYVANFGNYGATYGSLSAVVVLLTWLYLSSYALLFGAELNSELEHQTRQDTTDGPSEPLGERQAWVADHVAGEATPSSQARPNQAPVATSGEPEPNHDPDSASRDERRQRVSSTLARLESAGPTTDSGESGPTAGRDGT